MPKATKRERQRQNKEARRAAVQEAEKRHKRNRTIRNLVLLLIPLAIVFVVLQLTKSDSSDKKSSSSSSAPTNFATTCDTALPTKSAKTTLPKPGMGIDTKKDYTAVLHTTEGDVTIALDASEAPKTVNSFVYLACKGFYNGTTFHRIVTDFVDQGGDPKGDGTGGPGYTLPDEPPADGYKAGSVAMANAGSGTTGSQFFLVVSDAGAQNLGTTAPYKYSALGTMDAAGLDVAKTINTFGSADSTGTPTKTITINGVTVTDGSSATTTTAAP
ncbi:MAG TPA: peptidylprolyl isomerase [Acidimicrobiia bacterium]